MLQNLFHVVSECNACACTIFGLTFHWIRLKFVELYDTFLQTMHMFPHCHSTAGIAIKFQPVRHQHRGQKPLSSLGQGKWKCYLRRAMGGLFKHGSIVWDIFLKFKARGFPCHNDGSLTCLIACKCPHRQADVEVVFPSHSWTCETWLWFGILFFSYRFPIFDMMGLKIDMMHGSKNGSNTLNGCVWCCPHEATGS